MARQSSHYTETSNEMIRINGLVGWLVMRQHDKQWDRLGTLICDGTAE